MATEAKIEEHLRAFRAMLDHQQNFVDGLRWQVISQPETLTEAEHAKAQRLFAIHDALFEHAVNNPLAAILSKADKALIDEVCNRLAPEP